MQNVGQPLVDAREARSPGGATWKWQSEMIGANYLPPLRGFIHFD
jgi:hypothetical protein